MKKIDLDINKIIQLTNERNTPREIGKMLDLL